jgi:hypothetical protein
VLRIRTAITRVRASIGVALVRAGPPEMTAHAPGIGLGGASMEAEGLDAQTGERIVAVVDSRTGSAPDVSGLSTDAHAREVLRFWVERFVRRLDEAHGFAKTS